MFIHFQNEILKLKHQPHVDKKIISQFLARLKLSPNLTKDKNKADHFCSFFLPVHQKSGSIYLGHHIKANDWVPPGGHIKLGETPLQTVYREFAEELNHQLTSEPIELFDLTIKAINKPNQPCKIHYDFWYLVKTDRHDFDFLKREFYQARWLRMDEVPKLTQDKTYRATLNKIPNNSKFHLGSGRSLLNDLPLDIYY